MLSGFEQTVRRWRQSCCGGEDVERTLEVVADGLEVKLGDGFGETSPSHSAEPAAAFPGSEDLLNPATDAMNRLVPSIETRERLPLVVTSQHRHEHAWRAPLA